MGVVTERPVIYDREGQDIIFRLPEPGKSGLPSGYAFSMHKAGSTLLFSLLHGLCELVGLQYVSIMDEAFTKGFRPYDLPENTSQIFLSQGYFLVDFGFYLSNSPFQDSRGLRRYFSSEIHAICWYPSTIQ